MFDSNAMAELAHLARARYERAGGGGAHKVHATSQAYWESRGWKELSKFEQARIEARERFRSACQIQSEQFRLACWRLKEGFGDDEQIPL